MYVWTIRYWLLYDLTNISAVTRMTLMELIKARVKDAFVSYCLPAFIM